METKVCPLQLQVSVHPTKRYDPSYMLEGKISLILDDPFTSWQVSLTYLPTRCSNLPRMVSRSRRYASSPLLALQLFCMNTYFPDAPLILSR
jgi:uncharacterized membrane protein